MYATIFCAENIHTDDKGTVISTGLNNVFALPFIPTLFSFSMAAVIYGVDRTKKHKLNVELTDPKNNKSILVDLDLNEDSKAMDFSSTTLTTTFNNLNIFNDGEHDLTVLIDGTSVGSTKLFFTQASRN